MKPKTSQGKKLAFGFLRRVGSKDKYAKRLDKLKQGVLRGTSGLNGPLQTGEEQQEEASRSLSRQRDLGCALEAMMGSLDVLMQGGPCRRRPARAAKAKPGSKAAAKASSGHGAFFRKASAQIFRAERQVAQQVTSWLTAASVSKQNSA